MKPNVEIWTCFLFTVAALTSIAWASDDSPITVFLGSPLLILVALIIIDAIALAYHKIRK